MLNLTRHLRYRLSSLILLTAAIAVMLGGYRLWLQSQAPFELDRALAECDTLRIQYPTQDQSRIVTWELSDRNRIQEIRKFMAIPYARVNTSDDVIMGGPGLTVTLLRNNQETANFYIVYYMLTTPDYPSYKSRRYWLQSGEAWNILLIMSEQQALRPAQSP